MPEGIPKQIGRFTVLNELGRGAFGRVYRAVDPLVSRQVAIKVLSEAGKVVQITRFRNEAAVAGNLRHPNIVTVYEYGEHEGQPFLVMEYLEGEDLHRVIGADRPLTLLDKCNIMSQVADGLYCAHQNGVVHRDVKPANIMMLLDGTVKIMDFGIARLTRDDQATRLTQEGYMIGTVLYMAPEQFAGSDVDPLCDIFAYGVIYYELLTGKHPFKAADLHTLMYNINFETPRPIREFLPDCPEALQPIISRLLSKDRELRYQNLNEVQFDIAPIRMSLQRQRVAELLTQAQQFLDSKQLDQAQKAALDVLGIDPSNVVARKLWGNVHKQLEQRALQPRIELLLAAGEEHLAQRRFTEGINSFEAAMRLDRESAHIRSRLEYARGLLERSKAAASLLAAAQKEYSSQNLTAAYRAVSDALRHEPENPQAGELLKVLQIAIEHRQWEQKIADAVHKAEGLMLLRSYDEAIALLTALGPDVADPAVDRILSSIRAEKQENERRQKLQSAMAAATELLRSHHLGEAVSSLQELQKEFPDNKDVTHLLTYALRELEAATRARAIEEVSQKATALARSGDFDGALALLEAALNTYPGEGILIRLVGSTIAARSDRDRQQAIEATLQECAELRSQQRFAEAIEKVEATLRDYNGEPALVELLEQLEKDWAAKRRAEAIRKAAGQASNLLDQKRATESLRFLQEATVQYPDEPLLADLLERAQREVQALERARAVEAISQEAASYAAAHDFDRAFAAIDKGLKAWPGDSGLLRQREEIDAVKAAWDRQREINEVTQSVLQLISRKQFSEAAEAVAAVLGKYPGEKSLTQLEEAVSREREQHQRREAIQHIASEVRVLISRARLDEALEILNEATRKYPGEADLGTLLAQVQQLLVARRRAVAVEKLVKQSQDLVAALKFDRARELLERGLSSFPGEPALIRQLDSVKTAAADWEREEAVRRIIAEAAQRAKNLQFQEALQLLATAPAYSPALLEAQRQIEKDWEQHRRREAVAKAVADITALLDRGRHQDAIELLNEISTRYPQEHDWKPLLARAQEQLLAWKAAEEQNRMVQDTIRECEGLGKQSRWEEALQRVDQALQRYQGEGRLIDLQERLKTAWAVQKRAEAVSRVVADAEALLRDNRLEEAIGRLRDGCTQYPGEPALNSLLAKAEERLKARQLRDRTVREAESLLEQEKPDEAIRTLEPVLARYAADAEVKSLLARARAQVESRQRREAVEKLAKESLALASGHEFKRALARLDRGLESWPGEPRLLETQQSIRAAQAVWEREQARLQAVESVRGLAQQGRFPEAIERAEAALRAYPGDPELLRLRKECRMRKLMAEARALSGSGRPVEALKILESAGSEYVQEPEWSDLKGRVEAEVLARKRAEAIEKKCSEVRERVAEHDFEGALAMLEAALREWPGQKELIAARQSVLSAKALYQRQEAIRIVAAECTRLEKEGRLAAAMQLLEASLRDFPNEPVLLEWRERLQRALQEDDERRNRQRALEELRGLQEQMLHATGTAQIPQMLERARRIVDGYPGDQEILSAGADPIAYLSDVESARREIRNRNFAAALEICVRSQAKYAGNAIFAELKQEAELGQRAAYLADLQRRAAAERDLGALAKLLQEGLDRYPDEEWISAELRLTRNKLSLVESIVKNARERELAEDWDQALEQWAIVPTIYAQYPGLNDEVRRVTASRESARLEAVARWVQQIEQKLASGARGKARDLLQQALTAVPDAPPLLDLRRRLDELQQRSNQARELLAQGQAACEKGNYEEGKGHLHRAFELDQDVVFRTKILNALIRYAQAAQPADWRQAESLLGEVTALDPRHPVPGALTKAIADAKKEETVTRCLATASQLSQAGNLRGALAEIEQALSAYPKEGRLTAVRDELRAAIRRQREGLLAEIRSMDSEARAGTDLARLQSLVTRARTIAAEAAADTELAGLAGQSAKNLSSRIRQVRWAQGIEWVSSRRKKIAVAGAVAAALVLGAVGISRLLFRGDTVLNISSPQNGASVSVAAKTCVTPNCALKLPPGKYTLTAQKDGFKPISLPLVIPAKQRSLDIPLAFEALPEMLQINTNFESGRVVLDGRQAGDLQGGQFSLTGVAEGKHRVRVTGEGAEFEASWQSKPGELPALLGPIQAKDVQAAMVAHAGATGAILCNCESKSIEVDGAPAGQTGAPAGTPTPLQGLREGARSISIDGRVLIVNMGPDPTLNISLALNREIGTLVIETGGEDNVRVYLNDQPDKQTTQHGMVRLPLAVGRYSVRVEKEGFRSSPGTQTVDVKKGEDRQLTFRLVPIPATLEIAGATPGAQVKLDGRPIGTIGQNGMFRQEVTPGDHQIELTKDDYTPVRFQARFTPGTAIRPPAEQVAMSRIPRPLPPPPPPTKTVTRPIEATDWQAVENSNNPADFDEFARKHPDSPRATEARTRAAQLRQQIQLNADRQAEQAAWDGTDKNNKAALQAFLSRYGGGQHAPNARTRITEIERREADDLARAQAAEQRAQDERAVRGVLSDFGAAYRERNSPRLKDLCHDDQVLRMAAQEFKVTKTVTYGLQPISPPVITGDVATIDCNRSRSMTAQGQRSAGQDPVHVILDRAGSSWVIRSITHF